MGQSVSRGLPWPARLRRDRSSPLTSAPEVQQRPDAPPHTLPARIEDQHASSTSNLLDERQNAGPAGSGTLPTRRRSTLQRACTSFTSAIPNILTRHSSSRSEDPTFTLSPPPRLLPSPRSVASNTSAYVPRLTAPDIEIHFDDLASDLVTPTRPLIRRESHGSSSMTLDRLTSLRPDRSIRNMTNSSRRRRSPAHRTEDQAVVLSRLLSVAAAATAQSLMGSNHMTGSQPRAGQDADGEDGTFDGFLRALQNGRIAPELRQRNNEIRRGGEDGQGRGGVGGLNFFRMFRFASSNPADNQDGSTARSVTSEVINSSGDSPDNVGENADGRMVPIIIVGIRATNPGGNGTQDDGNVPSFLESLSTIPTPALRGPDSQTIDGILTQPQNGTRFSHRTRASMGGLHTFPSSYDRQRHYRSPDLGPARLESQSPAFSEIPPGHHSPPSTPADGRLSAVSSGHSTPTGRSALSPTASRGESFICRTRRSSLEFSADQPSLRPLRTARHRRLSESDFSRYGSGSSRRNGIVGTDSSDNSNGEGSRSWIIYVLGGSYPENHPILTTPNLFTDSPTYEDIMLLFTLLGSAKPPVASDEEVATAGGVFRIVATSDGLVATAIEGSELLPLTSGQRCIVCQCDLRRVRKFENLWIVVTYFTGNASMNG